MAVTEEDLQAKRDKLRELTERREGAIIQRTENETIVGREIESKQLDVAIAQADAEAQRAERSAKRAAVRAGVAPVAETLAEQKKDAVTVARAQAKAADQEGK